MVEENKLEFQDLEEVFAKLNISDGPVMDLENLLTEKKLKGTAPFELGCTICRQIVKPPMPKKCQKCDTLFCDKCVTKWQTTGHSDCPAGCGLDPMQSVEPSRLERTVINNIMFECFRCEQEFKYEDAIKHASTCGSFSCPMECGKTGLLTKQQLHDHFKNQCPGVILTCKCCPKIILTDQTCPCPIQTKTLLNDALEANELLNLQLLEMTKKLQEADLKLYEKQLQDQRYFKKCSHMLDDMIEQYSLNTPALKQALYNPKLGQLAFPLPPIDKYWNPNRKFTTWMKYINPHGQECMYQGELNQTGRRDGRGISLFEGSFIDIAHYKNGLTHGQNIRVSATGERWLQTRQDSKRHGKSLTYNIDGNSETEVYENDVLVLPNFI